MKTQTFRSPVRRLGAVARIVAAVTIVACAAFAVGCQAPNDKSVRAQAESTHGELSKAVITDPQMAGYIQGVGNRVVTTAGSLYKSGYRPKKKDEKEKSDWMFNTQTMQFHFVNSKTLNAFTTGGTHMYVYTELLRRCKNEDELAAVMAHEYGHVFGRHVQNGMTRQTLAMLGAGAAGVAGYAIGGEDSVQTGTGVGAAVAGLANAKFSREDESEADHLGFDFYVRAGYNPDNFASFFRTLMEVEKASGGGGMLAEFTSDHPATAQRVSNSEKWAKEYKQQHKDWQTRMKGAVAEGAAFQQIQARSTQLAGTMPDDQSLQAQKLVSALPRSCLWPDEPQPTSAKQAQESLKQDVEKKQPKTQPVKK
jgi:predicted Zn-dependent protease